MMTDTRRYREDTTRYVELRSALADFPTSELLPGKDDAWAAAGQVAAVAVGIGAQDYRPAVAGAHLYGRSAGRTFLLGVSPGTVQLRAVDVTKADARGVDGCKTIRGDRSSVGADIDSLYINRETGDFELPDAPARSEITNWSSKSRARMFQAVAQLDLSRWEEDGGDLAMVTLTLPAWWELIAPDGKTFKKLIRTLFKRWARVIGPVRGLWKLEFHRRGAPHLHALMRVPALVAGQSFDLWLARQWANICRDSLADLERDKYVEAGEYRRHVNAGTSVDFSTRNFSDPRRIATYFLGHSSKHVDGKEYQHVVPELWQAPGRGPGRFWGVWGLERGVVEVEVSVHQWVQVRRVLRHVARARSWRQRQDAARYGRSVRRRPLRSLGHGGALTGGVVVVNDGVLVGYDVARVLGGAGWTRARSGWSGVSTYGGAGYGSPLVGVELVEVKRDHPFEVWIDNTRNFDEWELGAVVDRLLGELVGE